MCSRINLYELLLTQLNPNNVLMGKKILSYEENELGVNVCCADNSTYCGDILVGADGAYSRIRQTLHRNMHKRGLLSKADKEQRIPGYVCVAGVAKQDDCEKYPYLKDPYVHFCSVLGTKGLGWHTVNIPDNQICWAMWMQLDQSAAEKEQQSLENSEFSASDTEPLAKVFRDMLCPHGGTMGDLVDSTPQDIMSKLYIEEKLYDSWYYGRTVLLGDACHSVCSPRPPSR
ncbi:hypothetical protein EDD21DRAFT_94666 [Dissophora ornata]|nr:hypothetical protein EDD21DRAFT_94666 [Dissophora ornata]